MGGAMEAIMSEHARSELRRDRGSVLIIAVIAMLVLGVLGVSFAVLSRIETSIGFNYKQQAQAEALAEAALDRARDELRNAATATDGFSAWLNTVLWGGAQTPSAYAGNAAYWYRARVDNDCAALNTVPASIQEPVTCANAAIRNTTDANETAVVTAWAEAGSGRARVRAILSIDNAWKHVCSDHEADNGGLCNNDANTNGNPSIQPADPNDPNGPAFWDDLPRPYLGCSRIDPLVHKRAGDSDAQQSTACGANPGVYSYPYPGHLTAGTTPRFVVMGQDPNAVGAPANTPYCGTNGASGFKYFGYFDCALSTPCPASVCGSIRKACVQANDPRATTNPAEYHAANPTCGAHTGMVFIPGGPQFKWDAPDVGSQSQGYTIYVLNGKMEIQDRTVYGTVVVEGDSSGTACPNDKDVLMKTRGKIWTGPNTSDTTGWTMPRQYGYPLALLVYDPELADPTPSGTPQGTCLDMGSAGGGAADRSQIHGLVYSGGHVEFNPFVLDGGVVAWQIQTQSTSSNYAYNYVYGNATPPPGFPKGGGTDVKVVRKSFIVCSNYSDESAGATACQ
jgi:Tfp pilus assembly protein PilX